MIFIGISVVGVAVYVALLLGGATNWPKVMASCLGAAMAAGVVGEIVASTARKGETEDDARDLEIRRYGMYVGHFAGVIGGVAALVFAMLDMSTFVIAHVLYAGFVVSALISASVRLHAYKNGLPR
ncbi:MAG: hypothetical protein ACO1OB_28680 [Archangium sp.]